MRTSIAVGLIAVVLALLPGKGEAAPETPSSPGTGTTRVAILPVLERSGRENKERAQFIEAGMAALREGFGKAQFAVVENGEVEAATLELQIDLADPDQRTREHLGRLATRLGARFVASAAILDVDSRLKVGFLSSRKQGTATVELAVYDAQTGQFTLRDTYRATKKGSALFAGLSSSRTKRTGAIEAAMEKGVKEFVRRLREPSEANSKS